MTPRFEDALARKLVGIRRQHNMANPTATIPQQWQEFRSLGLRSTRAPRAFGVLLGSEGTRFDYLTALDAADVVDVPAATEEVALPAHRYAVFTHDGHISGISESWRYIYQDWLPTSGYQYGHAPPMEIYDQRFDPESGTGSLELWLPIRSD